MRLQLLLGQRVLLHERSVLVRRTYWQQVILLLQDQVVLLLQGHSSLVQPCAVLGRHVLRGAAGLHDELLLGTDAHVLGQAALVFVSWGLVQLKALVVQQGFHHQTFGVLSGLGALFGLGRSLGVVLVVVHWTQAFLLDLGGHVEVADGVLFVVFHAALLHFGNWRQTVVGDFVLLFLQTLLRFTLLHQDAGCALLDLLQLQVLGHVRAGQRDVQDVLWGLYVVQFPGLLCGRRTQ